MSSGSAAEQGHASQSLCTSVGEIRLRSPLIIAAGPWSAGEELGQNLAAEVGAAGALITKTVTHLPRAGNPEPTVCQVTGGLINRVGLRNPGITEFITQNLPRLLALGVPILVSVAAERTQELGALITQLEESTSPLQVVGYELNASCPNTDGALPDPAELGELTAAARKNTSRPLWVKLGYAEPTLLCLRGRACATAGADAIVACNTVPVLVLREQEGELLPGRQKMAAPFLGGLSGASLHPLALRAVWELTRAQPLPVLGCGGVLSRREVLAFFAVGARAVQVGSALYPAGGQPPLLPRLYAELLAYSDTHGQRLLPGPLEVQK